MEEANNKNMKKIIVAGNKNYGLAKSIFEAHSDAKFYSRTNGNLDLGKPLDRDVFVNHTLDYDVFISCSYLPDFKQLFLVGKVWRKWNEEI